MSRVVLLEANAVPYVCKIDIDLYRCAAKDICSDEVIITEKQIEHICRRHGGDYGCYAKYLPEVLQRPDYILADNKPNTAVVLKKLEAGLKLVLRLKTPADAQKYKNSIITFQKEEEKRYQRYTRSARVLYKREGLE